MKEGGETGGSRKVKRDKGGFMQLHSEGWKRKRGEKITKTWKEMRLNDE